MIPDPIGDDNLVDQFHAVKLQRDAPIGDIGCVCECVWIVVCEVLPPVGLKGFNHKAGLPKDKGEARTTPPMNGSDVCW